MELEGLQVLLVGMRAIGGEDGVVPAPDHERWGLVGAEVRLPRWIQGRVGAVVVKQLQLDRLVAGTVLEILIRGPGVGADGLRVAGAVGVLPLGGAQVQEPLQRLGFLFRAILPIGAERVPEFPQPFLIGVAVLDDQRLDALRMAAAKRKPTGTP